ncbi:MAG: response regulator [Anaerolineae bacterium]|nr:response regulator [Anaerolineae bacterium]
MNTPSLSVLLIDDDSDARQLFHLALTHHCIACYTCGDAESAFNLLEKKTPDVIVIDIYLSETNGYEILQILKEGNMAPHSVIVATTAYHSTQEVTRALLSGFDAYMPKPFDIMGLGLYLQTLIKPAA